MNQGKREAGRNIRPAGQPETREVGAARTAHYGPARPAALGPRMTTAYDMQPDKVTIGALRADPLSIVAGPRCPRCGEDGKAEPCVFCGQLQDPACGYGTRYDPPTSETPGRWRCSECGAVTADEPPALLARKDG